MTAPIRNRAAGRPLTPAPATALRPAPILPEPATAIEPPGPSAAFDHAQDYARERHAPATRRAYRTDYRLFSLWARGRGLVSLPAEPATVAAFLASEADAGRSVSTLEHRMAAIRYAHLLAGHEAPTTTEVVRATLAGIRRTRAVRPVQKTPATVDLVEALVSGCGEDLHGRRDRALLLLGFAGAFRRSELAAIEREHLTWEQMGLRIFLPSSKTDQEGRGEEVAVLRGERLCPVLALDSWLEAACILGGPIFRAVLPGGKVSVMPLSDRSVALIVKRRALAAGLDPDGFSGHSLRAGFLTSAAEAGAGLFAMMDVSRHKSVETVRGYIRRADAFKNHAAKGLL